MWPYGTYRRAGEAKGDVDQVLRGVAEVVQQYGYGAAIRFIQYALQNLRDKSKNKIVC
jgi:hypothetical protein